MARNGLTYYARPGPMTTPGLYASLLDALPGELAKLAKSLQGLMLQIFWAENYGVSLTDERKA